MIAQTLHPAPLARVALVASAWLLFAAGAAHAAPPPDIDALVSYETRQLMASGVTRTDTWQERLVRRGDQVWTERVLPEHRHASQSANPHAGHKHLNAETAARWLRSGPRGEVELKLVDREHKVVVAVPKAEFASVSFDGRADAAGSIVPAAVVKPMKTDGPATPAGQWRVERIQGWSHRVLWSDANQLAMQVESKRDDGSVSRRVSVRLRPPAAGAAAPWDSLADYRTRQYDEYMD